MTGLLQDSKGVTRWHSIRTGADLRSRDRVVKRSEKDGLYSAMDISAIWLERALAGK